MSASTENAPVYNVIQLPFNKYKWLKRISNYGNLKVQNFLLKWWRTINNDLYQQFKFTLQILIATMKKQYPLTIQCQYNISAKYLYECVAKTLCKKPLRQLIFLLQKSCFSPITTHLHMSISFRKSPLYQCHKSYNVICTFLHVFNPFSLPVVYFLSSSLSGIFFF